MRRMILAAAVLACVATTAEAQCANGRCVAPAAGYYQQTTAYAGDAYGFGQWLNSVRAGYGLPPVGYDPNLTGWAAANSAEQCRRGLGHHVFGPARRQNSGYSPGGFGPVPGMWLASPGHRAALLDPTIRWYGIAAAGAYYTFSAR